MNAHCATRCPCGSGRRLSDCCGSLLDGTRLATTPEALMRSRYAAFVGDALDYLKATWHATTRPSTLAPDPATQWKALEIVDAPAATGDEGRVHFRAYFKEGERWQVLEENSRFVFEEGRWWYVDGDPRLHRLKPGRNDPCPCGSGRKLKRCC